MARGGQLRPQKLIDVNPRRAVLCADESRAFFLYARTLRGEVVGAEVDHAHGVGLLSLHGFDDLEACPCDGVVEGEGARSGFRMPGTEQEVVVFTYKSTIPGAHQEFGRGRVGSPMERATALFVGFCGTTRAHEFLSLPVFRPKVTLPKSFLPRGLYRVVAACFLFSRAVSAQWVVAGNRFRPKVAKTGI